MILRDGGWGCCQLCFQSKSREYYGLIFHETGFSKSTNCFDSQLIFKCDAWIVLVCNLWDPTGSHELIKSVVLYMLPLSFKGLSVIFESAVAFIWSRHVRQSPKGPGLSTNQASNQLTNNTINHCIRSPVRSFIHSLIHTFRLYLASLFRFSFIHSVTLSQAVISILVLFFCKRVFFSFYFCLIYMY